MSISEPVTARPPDIEDVWPRNARPSDELLFQGPPTISPRVIRTTSIVCFLAWVFSVYDFVLFGTLLPKIADEFGWSASYATAVATCDRRNLRGGPGGGAAARQIRTQTRPHHHHGRCRARLGSHRGRGGCTR